ncbi:MAG: sigma-70 family RNA polymerase sigma factor [Deltaproteobacteria bacterium]|nr:sigma-70 family RNA polymerase sigma factor [Deltaproteobacteria bacterium]
MHELHEDAALLKAYRAGETWAFELLYRQYTTMVTRFLLGGFTFVSQGRTCRYRGGNAGVDVDAIVQETFTRAFSSSTRTHYDGERPFKNYLLSIAKNLVLRELARHERTASLDSMEETTDVVLRRARANGGTGLLPDERSPEKAAGDAELTAITTAFIESLDAEERDFFHHRFVSGLTQEATADEMACTRARVKLLEKSLRVAFLEKLRSRGYFVDHEMKPRWSRKAA